MVSRPQFYGTFSPLLWGSPTFDRGPFWHNSCHSSTPTTYIHIPTHHGRSLPSVEAKIFDLSISTRLQSLCSFRQFLLTFIMGGVTSIDVTSMDDPSPASSRPNHPPLKPKCRCCGIISKPNCQCCGFIPLMLYALRSREMLTSVPGTLFNGIQLTVWHCSTLKVKIWFLFCL